MATPRDVEEEERRLDAKPRTAAASTDTTGSPAVPQTALPTGAANAAAANAARTNARQANLRGPPLPAPAAATTTTSSSAGRDAPQREPAVGAHGGAAVSEGDTPHLHHNTRAGHPQPWGVGGGIGAAPYRADAPVYGLVGRDSDMLPSVLGPTDYAALIAGGLGDETTLIGGGGGMPLQSHQERMEERARAAARRAVNAAHAQAAADASSKQKEGDIAQGPPTAAAPPDASDPAKTTDAAVEARAGAAGAAGDRPAQSGDAAPTNQPHHHHHDRHGQSGNHTHHTHTHGNHTHGHQHHDQAPAAANSALDAAVGDAKPKDPKQQASSGRNDPRLAPPSPPAACGRGHCSPGVAHDVGYEHDL